MERLRYHVLKAKPTSPLCVQHGGRAAMAFSPPPPEEREQAQRRCPAQHVEKLVAEEKPRRENCIYYYVHGNKIVDLRLSHAPAGIPGRIP
ncbi:MAG: hypothetical protein RXO32_06010 [Thermoproteus sp.]